MEAENRQEGPSQEAFLTGLQFLLAFDAPLPLLWRGGGGPDTLGACPAAPASCGMQASAGQGKRCPP